MVYRRKLMFTISCVEKKDLGGLLMGDTCETCHPLALAGQGENSAWVSEHLFNRFLPHPYSCPVQMLVKSFLFSRSYSVLFPKLWLCASPLSRDSSSPCDFLCLISIETVSRLGFASSQRTVQLAKFVSTWDSKIQRRGPELGLLRCCGETQELK